MRLKICIYAFSTTAYFFRALVELCNARNDDIEWSVIFPQGHFRHVFRGIVPPERQFYLYEDFARRYAAADAKQIRQAMDSGDGLVSALFRDKLGFRLLDKSEQLRRGAAIDAGYREFLMRIAPDYLLLTSPENVDDLILHNLCAELKIGVLCSTAMRFVGLSFFGNDPHESLPKYFGSYRPNDVSKARDIIGAFRAGTPLTPTAVYPARTLRWPSLLRRMVYNEYLRWRYERLHATEHGYGVRIKHNLLPLVRQLRRQRFDRLLVRHFDIGAGDAGRLPDKYILYALQYTPESSINALDPYFVDQTRVIDALLLSLPRGFQLVVKEHPAMYGIRPASFYRTLRRKPGLVLVHPSSDTRELATRAALIATVNGTIGLEAFLLDRPCIMFGRNFFAHLCARAPSVNEMPRFVQHLVDSYIPMSEERKEVEIAKFVNVGGDFLIADPWYAQSVVSDENVAAAREYLRSHLSRLGLRDGLLRQANSG